MGLDRAWQGLRTRNETDLAIEAPTLRGRSATGIFSAYPLSKEKGGWEENSSI